MSALATLVVEDEAAAKFPKQLRWGVLTSFVIELPLEFRIARRHNPQKLKRILMIVIHSESKEEGTGEDNSILGGYRIVGLDRILRGDRMCC